MKTGKTLTELAAEIERQSDAKADYLIDTRHLEMQMAIDTDLVNAHGFAEVNLPDEPVLVYNSKAFPAGETPPPMLATEHAHRQVAGRIQVPWSYYQRMMDNAPNLLAGNVNHWLQAAPERRMVRTLDGEIRSFLSDRYQRIDNDLCADAIFPVLASELGGQPTIDSCEITPLHFYLKLTCPWLTGTIAKRDAKVGDAFEAGFVFRNSEVGAGATQLVPFIKVLSCLNGMYATKFGDGLRRVHLGKQIERQGALEVNWQEDTRAAQLRALQLEIRDACKRVASMDTVAEIEGWISSAQDDRITGDVVKAAEVLQRTIGLSDGERGSVLRHLIEGGDLSRWGVCQAVTRTSQDADNYERATELEQIGPRVIDLPRTDWNAVAVAA
jgi:hypothetical protein